MACLFETKDELYISNLFSSTTPEGAVKAAYNYIKSKDVDITNDELADELYKAHEAYVIYEFSDMLLSKEATFEQLMNNYTAEKYREELDNLQLVDEKSLHTDEPKKSQTQDNPEAMEVVLDLEIQDDGNVIYPFPSMDVWKNIRYHNIVQKYYGKIPRQAGIMNTDFRKRFYNYALFDPNTGEVYNREVSAERMKSFKLLLQSELASHKDQVDQIREIGSDEVISRILNGENLELQEAYNLLVMYRSFDSLVHHNYGKMYRYDESKQSWMSREEVISVRQSYQRENDAMEDAFQALMSSTMTHLESAPLLRKSSVNNEYESTGEFLTKYQVYRFLAEHMSEVTADENSIYNLLEAKKEVSDVARGLYTRFFAQQPTVIDGKRQHSFRSIVNKYEAGEYSDARSALLKFRERAEDILTNLMSSIASFQNYTYLSIDSGNQVIPTHGTATAEQLKEASISYISKNLDKLNKLVDVTWDNQKGTGTLKIGRDKYELKRSNKFFKPIEIVPPEDMGLGNYDRLLKTLGVDISNAGIQRVSETYVNYNGQSELNQLIGSMAYIIHANNESSVRDPYNYLKGTKDKPLFRNLDTILSKYREENRTDIGYKPIKYSPSALLFEDFNKLARLIDNVYDIEKPDITRNSQGNIIRTNGLSALEFELKNRIFEVRSKVNGTNSVHENNIVINSDSGYNLEKIYSVDAYNGIPHKKLTDTNNFKLDFLGIFSRSVTESNFTRAKLNYMVFSDKATLPIAEISQENREFLPVSEGGLNTARLFSEYKKSIGDYYQRAEQHLIQTWKDAIPRDRDNASAIHSAKTSQELYQAVLAANITLEEVQGTELVNEFDYIQKNDGFVTIRQDLNELIKIHKNDKWLNEFLTDQKRRFIENLTETDKDVTDRDNSRGRNMNFKLNDPDYQDINEAISKRFSNNSKAWLEGEIVAKNGEINPLVEGYFYHSMTIGQSLSMLQHGSVFQYSPANFLLAGDGALDQYDDSLPEVSQGHKIGSRIAALQGDNIEEKEDRSDEILNMREDADKFSYTNGQENALKSIARFIDRDGIESDQKFFMLSGYAGTGKTTIIENILKYALKKGKKVRLTAPTNKAVRVIEDKTKKKVPEGKEDEVIFETIYKSLGFSMNKYAKNPKDRYKYQKDSLEDSIIIVDEASMLNTEIFNRLNKVVSGGSMVIFVGDDFQLEPVDEDPKLFEWNKSMFNRNNFTKLTEVKRQNLDSGILTVATAMRSGKNKDVLLPAISTNDFKVLSEGELVKNWLSQVKNDDDVIMIVSTNNQRVSYNMRARREKFGPLATTNLLKGDKLISMTTSLLRANGETFDLDDNLDIQDTINIKVQNPKGRWLNATLHAAKLKYDITVDGKTSTVEADVFFTPDAPVASIHWGDLSSETSLQMNKGLAKFIKDNMDDPDNLPEIYTYAYAITGHKSQGSQWKDVYMNQIALPQSFDGARWMYTAITRGVENVSVASGSYTGLDWKVLRKIASEASKEVEVSKEPEKEETKEESPITHIVQFPDEQIDKILSGEKTLSVRTDAKNIGIQEGETGIVDIGGKLFFMRNRGRKVATDLYSREEASRRIGFRLVDIPLGNPLIEGGVLPTDMNGHAKKDIQMAEIATKFIGFETVVDEKTREKSSTRKYRIYWADLANKQDGRGYGKEDVVMISGSGPWRGITEDQIKKTFNDYYTNLIDEAVEAGAAFTVGNAKGSDKLVTEYLEKSKNYIQVPETKGKEFGIYTADGLMPDAIIREEVDPVKIEGTLPFTNPDKTIDKDQIAKIFNGKKTSTVRSDQFAEWMAKNSPLKKPGDKAVINIGGRPFMTTYYGPQTITEAGGRDYMISTEALDLDSTGEPITKFAQTKKWLNSGRSVENEEQKIASEIGSEPKLHLYRFSPIKTESGKFTRKDKLSKSEIATATSTNAWLNGTNAFDVYEISPYNESELDKSRAPSKRKYYNKLTEAIDASYRAQSKRASLGTSTFYKPILANVDSMGNITKNTRYLAQETNIIYFNDISTDSVFDSEDAVSNDLKDRRVLSSGKRLKQKILDGGFYALPSYFIKMRNSLGGEYTQLNSAIFKNINTDHNNERGVVRHEKKATYPISNELVAMSRGNGKIDFEKLVIKMLSEINFGPTEVKLSRTGENVVANNMWDVFQALGGFANANVWEDLVNTEYINPSINNKYVLEVGINTSVKTGQKKTNPDLIQVIQKNIPLVVDRKRQDNGGIQLNPDHDPNKVKDNLSMVTQMIKSAVLEGNTPELATDIMNAIARLSEYKLDRDIFKNKDFGDNIKALVRTVMEEAAYSSDHFDQTVDRILDRDYDINFSDRSVLKRMFQQVSSTVMNSGVRHKFKGGGYVMTPVTNIVMVYDVETPKGTMTMTRPDLELYAKKKGINLSQDPELLLTTEGINLKPRNLNFLKYYNEKGESLLETDEWYKVQEAYDSNDSVAHANALKKFYSLIESGEYKGEPSEILLPSVVKQEFGIKPGTLLGEYLIFDRNNPMDNKFVEDMLSDYVRQNEKAPSKEELNLFYALAEQKAQDLELALTGLIARIPGSGKQSWNAFKIVGFMDGMRNAVGVPVDSMVIKGEDFDIDKGWVQFYEFIKSKKNPALNNKKFPWFTIDDETGVISMNSNNSGLRLMTKEEILNMDPAQASRPILSMVKNLTGIYPDTSSTDWYESGVKNFITSRLHDINLSGKNAAEVNTPVSTDEIQSHAESVRRKMYFTPWNALSVPMLRREQLMGKDMVGLEANGLKTYATIFHAVKTSNEDHSFDFKFFGDANPDGTYTIQTYTDIANVKDISRWRTQAWAHYSELINSAADNAKLLVLGKVSINETTSNMVNGLISIGVPFKTIINFLNNDAVLGILDEIESDPELTLSDIEEKVDEVLYQDPITKTKLNPNINKLDMMALNFLKDGIRLGDDFALTNLFLRLTSKPVSDPEKHARFAYAINQGKNGIRRRFKRISKNLDFDLDEFINDETYREAAIDRYEAQDKKGNFLMKVFINPLKIIANSPDVMSQLTTYSAIRKVVDEVTEVPKVTEAIYKVGSEAFGPKTTLDARYNVSQDMVYKFMIDQYLQAQGTISDTGDFSTGLSYNLAKLKDRNRFIENFPRYLNSLKKKYGTTNEFINSLITDNIITNFSDSRIPIVTTVDTRNMKEDRKSELSAALVDLRSTSQGKRDSRMLYLYGLMVTGGGVGLHSYMQFFDKEAHRHYNNWLNNFKFNEKLDMRSFSRMIAHLNPALYREFSSTDEFLDYRAKELGLTEENPVSKSKKAYYYKVKDEGSFRYRYYRAIGAGLINELKVDNPAHLLGIPFIMNEDGSTREQSMYFVASNRAINPILRKTGAPIFELIKNKLMSNSGDEDPYVRYNTTDGQNVSFETSDVDFLNRAFEYFMEDSEDSPVVYVSPNAESRSDMIDDVRRFLFSGNSDASFILKGERMMLSDGSQVTATKVVPASKTLTGTQITLNGVNVTFSDRRTRFIVDPKSYLEAPKGRKTNASKIETKRKALAAKGQTKQLETFNNQFLVLEENIFYSYALHPRDLKKANTVLLDEVSLYNEYSDPKARNEYYYKVFDSVKKNVVIRSNRFFKNVNQDVNKQYVDRNLLVKSKLSSMVGNVMENFISAMNDASYLGIKVESISTTEFSEKGVPVELQNVLKNKKSFAFNNTIYLISDNITIDSPIHEFSHLWLRAMKEYNPDLHEKLVNRALNHEYADQVKKEYPELDGELLGEEIFSSLVSGKVFDTDTNYTNLSDFHEYLNWVNDQVNYIFDLDGISIADTSLAFLAYMENSKNQSPKYFRLNPDEVNLLKETFEVNRLGEILFRVKDRLMREQKIIYKCNN